MIHVVLGMHKSGTTLVSHILHASGIAMVDEEVPEIGYDAGNTWERDVPRRLNHQMLQSDAVYSLNIRRPPGHRGRQPPWNAMRQEIATCTSRHADWGFKDPRTCLTYEHWARVLPPHSLIVVYRTAEEGWAHYWNSSRGRRRATVFHRFLPSWCEHNRAILDVLARSTMPAIVLRYAALMTGTDELERLGRFLARPLVDVRQPALMRSRVRPSLAYRAARRWHVARGGPPPEVVAEHLAMWESSQDAAATRPARP